MKLSIGGYSFFNSFKSGIMDVYGYFESVKYRYHLNAADMWNGLFRRDEQGRIMLPSDAELQQIKAGLDERGLIVPNIAIDNAHLIDPEPGLREELAQNAADYLHASEMLGAKTVRIDFCSAKTPEITNEDFDYIVGKYREFCDRAAEHGYIVGPENHMGAALDPYLLKRIAEAVDHPNFGILLHVRRWKPEFAEIGDSIVSPWTMHVHIDAKVIAAGSALQTVQTLRQAGYDGYWAVEYNAEDNQYVEIEKLLAAVKQVIHQSEKSM